MSADRSERTVTSRTSSTRKSSRSERSASTANRSSSARGSKDDQMDQSARPSVGSQRGHFKKFVMKVTEKMGAVDKTEYSPPFLEACKEFDQYKARPLTRSIRTVQFQIVIDDVALKICQFIQQDPNLVSYPLNDMKIEYPPGRNPFERSAVELERIKDLDPQQVESVIKLMSEYGVVHREYQQQGRRAIHFIRRFLLLDYDEINEQRRLLNRARQNMDFARYELGKAKTPELIGARSVIFETAQREFDDQLNKVTGLLNGTQKQKEKHAEEVLKFYTVYRRYFELMIQKGVMFNVGASESSAAN